MKRKILLASLILAAAVAVVYANNFRLIWLNLTGFEEVPSVSTNAEGSFKARIKHDRSEISYELKYSGLEGNVTQAHINLGQKGVNGGVSVFLCSNFPNPPAGTPACPAAPATLTGTITAANVIGPAAQGIAAGEFSELIDAIRAGKTYVNVHSDKFPGGEIRAQTKRDRDQHDDHDNNNKEDNDHDH